MVAPSDDGGEENLLKGCDFANARGLGASPFSIAGSGTITLDANGNLGANADAGQCSEDPALCGDPGVQLDAPSCVVNTNAGRFGQPFDGGLSSIELETTTSSSCGNSDPDATCPPGPTTIAQGWACHVTVAEWDTAALTPDDHTGYVVVQMKPPIPVSSETVPNTVVSVPPTCNGGACPVGPSGSYGPIAPGVDVKITGRRFPCHTVQPDDPSTTGHQGACIVAHTAKTVLVKRITTQLLEPSPTVLTQTAGLDGNYTVTFDMPDVVGSGFNDSYRFVAHAPDCAFNQGPSATDPDYPDTCESPRLNASGIRLFQ
jgi:hypothetical protein